MARVKRGVTARARHKKVLGKAKGYYGARRKVYRVAKQAVIKAGQYAYTGRRLKKAGVDIDRKMLADLAMNQPAAFAAIAQQAKAALDKAA